jgi:uncharacterized repeat protein (TIGR03803 family)
MATSVQHRSSVALTITLLLLVFVGEPGLAQTFRVLYRFTGQPDGYEPYGGLVRDGAGNLYGTSMLGGAGSCAYYGQQAGCGTVFEVRPTGEEPVLYSFGTNNLPDGASPEGNLVRDSQGNLYGTTFFGGNNSCSDDNQYLGCGVVFKIDTAGQETVLYRFSNSPDGANPYAGLVINGGTLYGTTVSGGAYGEGTVFKVTATGQETVIYSFVGGTTDGAEPYGGLVRDAAGNLYGTTISGGAYFWGTVFKLDPNGKETILHSFKGPPDDGGSPQATLVLASGNLYGGTAQGGLSNCGDGCGTLFQVNKRTGKEKVLYRFKGAPDGRAPGTLVIDAMSNVYGATFEGGTFSNKECPNGCGTVFKLSNTGKETVLHNFSGGSDGDYPIAGLVQDAKGRLYGASLNGGNSACDGGCGVVFKITP